MAVVKFQWPQQITVLANSACVLNGLPMCGLNSFIILRFPIHDHTKYFLLFRFSFISLSKVVLFSSQGFCMVVMFMQRPQVQVERSEQPRFLICSSIKGKDFNVLPFLEDFFLFVVCFKTPVIRLLQFQNEKSFFKKWVLNFIRCFISINCLPIF